MSILVGRVQYLRNTMFQDYDFAIVIDNGSGVFKAGFAGDDSPRAVFPSVMGGYKYRSCLGTPFCPCVGDEALKKSGSYTLKYPIVKGIVTNWDDMEVIWHHTFYNALRVSPEEHPILLTEVQLNPKAHRERITQIMFETYNVPALFVCSQPVLSLYHSGRSTGVVLDSGFGATRSVPIFEGFIIHHAVRASDVGGRDLTIYLMKLMNEKGYSLTTTSHQEQTRQMKEKVCYVARDFDAELKEAAEDYSSIEQKYKLSGEEIEVRDERFRSPEVLFKPGFIGKKEEGIHVVLVASIMRCEEELRNVMFANIVLAGGSTMFRGLPERLKDEISNLAPENVSVKIISPKERKHSAFIGGSILASLPTFKKKRR